MAGGNSRQRRRSNRAVGKAVVQAVGSVMHGPTTPNPNVVRPLEKARLNFGDSVGLISLLLAVIFVIVTPPFWIKVPLLALSACGLFVFARRSHWTHSWHPLYQYGSVVILVAILAGVAVPQLAAQWRSEHPVAGPPPPLEHVYDLSGDRRTKFEESLKKQTEPKAIIRVGCDDQSEQSCLAAGRFLLAISEAGWEIDSKQVFRMRQTIPKEGISVAWNDKNAEKYKNLPPHEGFWH